MYYGTFVRASASDHDGEEMQRPLVTPVIDCLPVRETDVPSYVGLALAEKHSSNTNIIPERVEEIESDSKNYDPPMYYGVPTLSTKCVPFANEYFGIDMSKEFAAWTFCICGESE